jgi:nucleoside-diphosphate-sugar epimerase
MKIHITGGKGFLAHWIVPLLRQTHEVFVTDRDSMDVTDYGAVLGRFTDERPDLVIHLAALCGAQPSRDDPPGFFLVNAQGAVNVMEACRRAGIKRFMLFSSMTVFGSGDEPRSETSPFAPRHPYAVSKVAAEYAALNYCQTWGIRTLVLRPTLVVGEGYKEPHAVGDFVETVLRGECITLFGGGHVRDFVHPEDVAQATNLAAERLLSDAGPAHESFNVSSGEAHRMIDLADLVIRETGRGLRAVGPSSNQSFSLYTGIDRARELLGYRPRVSTRDIVRRLMAQDAASRKVSGTFPSADRVPDALSGANT